MKNPNLKQNQGENNPMYHRHHTLESRRQIAETRKIRNIPNGMQGHRHTEESKHKMSLSLKGKESWMKGKHHSIETRLKLSEKAKNQERKIGWHHSEETRNKISQSNMGHVSSKRGVKQPNMSGSKHWNWQGGISGLIEDPNKTLEMKIMKRACFERDNFTCKECGQHGGKLNAHHIKPASLFPEFRLSLDNLATLCVNCHKKTDTYAGRIHKLKRERQLTTNI